MEEEFLEPILRKIRISSIKKYIPEKCILCDIGCGFNAKFLIDISDYILKGYGFDKKIENKSINNICLQNFNLTENIPLEDESVDCVTLLAVLEHLSTPIHVLSESYRILKVGGIMILTTPSPLSKPLLEFLSYRLKIVSPVEISEHKHYYSKKELIELFGRTGFKNVVTRSFEFGLNNLVIGYKK